MHIVNFSHKSCSKRSSPRFLFWCPQESDYAKLPFLAVDMRHPSSQPLPSGMCDFFLEHKLTISGSAWGLSKLIPSSFSMFVPCKLCDATKPASNRTHSDQTNTENSQIYFQTHTTAIKRLRHCLPTSAAFARSHEQKTRHKLLGGTAAINCSEAR